MRTTIDIPDPLFREVKTRAVQQGVTLKDLMARYIEEGLRGQSTPFVVRNRQPLPVAIRRDPTIPLTEALSNRELNDLLDKEDLGIETRAHQPQKDGK